MINLVVSYWQTLDKLVKFPGRPTKLLSSEGVFSRMGKQTRVSGLLSDKSVSPSSFKDITTGSR